MHADKAKEESRFLDDTSLTNENKNTKRTNISYKGLKNPTASMPTKTIQNIPKVTKQLTVLRTTRTMIMRRMSEIKKQIHFFLRAPMAS